MYVVLSPNVVFDDEWLKNGTKENKITVYTYYLSQCLSSSKRTLNNNIKKTTYTYVCVCLFVYC